MKRLVQYQRTILDDNYTSHSSTLIAIHRTLEELEADLSEQL